MMNQVAKSTYIYKFLGDFWINNRNYMIEIPMPTKHKTIKNAKNDNSSARFEKRNDHVVLVIYSKWEQGMKNGKWYEHVAGNELEIIRWEDWHRYKIAQAKGEGIEGMGADPIKDYLPFATHWDNLFDVANLPDKWGCTIESLAYSIFTYVDCED